MKLLLIFIIFIVSVHAQSILIMNSNISILKYKQAQEGFEKNFSGDVKSIDISKMKQKDIQRYLYSEYPDIVYTIGSLAYQYAYKYIPERKIFFSNIINFKRLPKKENYSGVLVELHSGMNLTIIRSVCMRSSKIGVLYSEYTKEIVQELELNAKLMGIEIVSQNIDSVNMDVDTLLKDVDALMLIADPKVLSDKNIVKKIFISAKANKKPVIAYDKLFIKYGAILSISADNPTIGAQVAKMMKDYIDKKDKQKIQYPLGTHVILNKREALKRGLDISKINLSNIDELIE